MNTNRSGVKENAFANIDDHKFKVNHDHIFNREKCKCEECEKPKELVSEPKELNISNKNGEEILGILNYLVTPDSCIDLNEKA